MSIQFTTRVDGSTLFVCASGFDDSLVDVKNYGMGVLTACLENNVSNVLCDETDLEYRLGTFDTYYAGEFLAEHVPKLSRAAIVCHPAHLDSASFFENVVVNRGLTLRVFTDIDTAKCWLSVP
ncbi:MAG: hypothetical protein NT163_12710 [Chlorobiales bacterium]|nr:hypothetical protein [Chlorobiales bacterium]